MAGNPFLGYGTPTERHSDRTTVRNAVVPGTETVRTNCEAPVTSYRIEASVTKCCIEASVTSYRIEDAGGLPDPDQNEATNLE